MMAPAPRLLSQHSRTAPLSMGKSLVGRPVPFAASPRPQGLRRQAPATVCMSAVAAPASLEVKSTDGSAVGTEQLALRVAEESARGLVHRYLVTVRQNARRGTASTKTRAEVRGGGAKPYKQKGTGNARRGSKRSPLMVGGGVSFGPRPRDWTIKMNKKEKRLAMATALQSAAGSIIVVEDLKDAFPESKTKSVVAALRAWGVGEEEHALLVTSELYERAFQAGRNVARLQFNTVAGGLNVYDVLRADKILVERSALAAIQAKYGPSDDSE